MSDNLNAKRQELLNTYDAFISDLDDTELLDDLDIFIVTLHEAFRLSDSKEVAEAKRLFAELIKKA